MVWTEHKVIRSCCWPIEGDNSKLHSKVDNKLGCKD